MLMRRPIYLLLIAYLALGIVYGMITPLFEAPDEQWHYAFVQYVATGHGLPVQAQPVQHLARQEGSQPPLYYVLAAAATFWIDTSDYPALVWENPHYGYNVPGVVNDNKNLFVHTAQEQFPFHNTSLAMHLARLLSLAMGAVAVYFTYRLTRLLFSAQNVRRESIARAAAAMVACTPQFLFISSAVSNDSTIVALSALTLFLLVRALRQTPTRREAFWIGAVCGLGALAKVSGLALLPLALAVIAYAHRQNARELFWQSALAAAGCALVAGWWYARNVILYGEVTGTARMLDIFGARANPLTFDQWRAQLYEVFETFWVGFGWGNIRAPEWVYALWGLLLGAGMVGLLLALWRRRTQGRVTVQNHAPLFVLAAWCAMIFVSLLRWMMSTQAPHGRLLFPALPALMPLLVVGWTQLAPPRAQFVVTRLIPLAAFGLTLVAPFALLAPAYAFPTQLREADVANIPARVDVRYGDSLMLLGSRVTPHPLNPRGALQVDLYWRVLKPMQQDYSINLSALDDHYRVVGTRNSFPGHGTLPTRLMQAGQIFHDTYWLPLNAPVVKGALQVSVFDRTTQQDLTAYDPAGNEITPLVNSFTLAP
jgi:4-amino-4-deoxy-L-arabinose transferase-like glycosyltransferase